MTSSAVRWAKLTLPTEFASKSTGRIAAPAGNDLRERERIHAVYDRYSTRRFRWRWRDGPGARHIIDGKWRAIRGALRHERLDMSVIRILDLGAGEGEDCHKLRQLGCRPDRILAIDLLDNLARSARRAYPWLASIQAGGWELPLAGASVDLVMQSTMLSSVINRGRRDRIYAEIRRVVRPGGLFVSYDLRYPNPLNRDVRPVPLQELQRAFGGWRVTAGSVTGIPPLVRALATCSRQACRLLESIPLLRSHLLVRARKPVTAGRHPTAS